MKQGLSELIEYLDKRFSSIDGALEDLRENKADKSDVRELRDAVDAYARRADEYFQEMVMLSRKVDRLEEAVKKIATQAGVDIDL